MSAVQRRVVALTIDMALTFFPHEAAALPPPMPPLPAWARSVTVVQTRFPLTCPSHSICSVKLKPPPLMFNPPV